MRSSSFSSRIFLAVLLFTALAAIANIIFGLDEAEEACSLESGVERVEDYSLTSSAHMGIMAKVDGDPSSLSNEFKQPPPLRRTRFHAAEVYHASGE